ncbi:GTP 3',8-cyclase MoaA [Alteribacter lacisalsi]|uniref:GTP 3',8-cyclase n=1 Tax=Alteribacter lacisalsi TaxID=2045244 RepID=A0A2W0H303_9BACI|nr:GTP 3',8-cyclase MoaA [Alteribacter lacisalsi]PYZ96193.1 GTP 3',8-cyclase MoaA [Alteribacter lacisalsi]
MKKQEQQAYDALFRPLKDLRISVTDQCNFRCSYCMPAEIFGPDYPFMKEDELLSFDEIVRLARQFAGLGVEKIRITGGEPLLRNNLPELVKRLKEIAGIKDVALTTNGVFLVKHAEALKKAGLDRVNVSLDAIEDRVFRKMNGRNVPVKPVLKGIARAEKAGLSVKVNMVVKKDANESQIVPMARYFKGSGVILRFIEFMDVGNTNGWNFDSVVPKKEIVSEISGEFPVEPVRANYYGEVADRYAYTDGEGEIGVISSVSDSFCSSCTRARLSADGKLFTCLFATKGEDIRGLIRDGIGERDLYEHLSGIWKNRHDRYSDERTEETVRAKNNGPKIEMSYIGG